MNDLVTRIQDLSREEALEAAGLPGDAIAGGEGGESDDLKAALQ